MSKSILFGLTLVLPHLSVFALLTVPKQSQPAAAPAEEPAETPIDLQGQYQVENPCCGVVLTGSGLYWKAYEEGLDYVIKNDGATSINDDGSVKRGTFDWNWGFRASAGFEIPNKKMNLTADWTHYRTTGNVSHHTTAPTVLFSVWSIPNLAGNQFEFQSKAHTRLSLNRIDFGFDTSFAARRFLDITPSINLSALWIDQKFKFDLSGGPGLGGLTVTDDKITMKNDFFGIGPKLGLDTLWSLGGGIGVVGNFNLSILYGFFDISQQETVTFRGSAPNTYLDVKQHAYRNPRIDFDLFLGLRWDRMFDSKKCHLLLEAGWENLIFLGQNQLMRFTNATYAGNNTAVQGDLAIQGLTLRGAITF